MREEAQSLFSQMYGSRDEQAALHYLTGYDLNHDFDLCMVNRGFEDWADDLTLIRAVPEVDPLGDTVWLREPMRPIASQGLQATAEFNRLEAKVESTELTAEQDAATEECRAANPGVSDDVLDQRGFSGVNNGRALHVFNAKVTDVDEDLADPAEYEACMKRAGFSLDHGVAGQPPTYQSEILRLQALAPRPDKVPLPGEPMNDAWRDFLEKEQKSLKADNDCRSSQYAEGMRRLGPVLEEFSSDFGEQISAYESHWRAVRAEAETKGWRPARGG